MHPRVKYGVSHIVMFISKSSQLSGGLSSVILFFKWLTQNSPLDCLNQDSDPLNYAILVFLPICDNFETDLFPGVGMQYAKHVKWPVISVLCSQIPSFGCPEFDQCTTKPEMPTLDLMW